MIALLMIASITSGGTSKERDTPPITVVSLGTVVAGLPIPVVLSIPGERVIVEPGLTRVANPLEWRLTSKQRSYVVPKRTSHSEARGHVRRGHVEPEDVEYPEVVVPGGSTNIYSMDLMCSGLGSDPNSGDVEPVDPASVAGGPWSLSWTDTMNSHSGASVSITFEVPNAAERSLIDHLKTARGNSDNRWAVFVQRSESVLAGVDVNQLSPAGKQQMQYLLLLARLVRDAAPIGELTVNADERTGLWSGFEPDVEVLEYEIALAKNDQVVAAAKRKRVLDARPNAEGLLNLIRDQGGFIKYHRERIRGR